MILKGLFPEFVACYSVDQADLCQLEEAEQALVQNLNSKVLDLFKMGRHAAHLALKDLGAEALAVGRGKQREPIWPEGYIGSIAHTQGMAVAVVGANEKVAGLGIDIEAADRDFRYPVEEKIASESEQKWILSEENLKRERTLALFSAKEAIFKAFYPLEKVYLNFLDVELSATENGFRGELKKSAGQNWPLGFSFRVLQSGWKGYLVSALTLIQKD